MNFDQLGFDQLGELGQYMYGVVGDNYPVERDGMPCYNPAGFSDGTPLLYACAAGQLRVVELLLQRRARVDLCNVGHFVGGTFSHKSSTLAPLHAAALQVALLPHAHFCRMRPRLH